MKIMVTGGAGFIGSHVVDKYIENGHEVIVVDNLSSGKIENVNKNARFYKIDIRSEELVNLIQRESPEIINHHAAQISVPDSVRDPIYDADINIKGLLNILEAAKSRIEKFIFISSGGAIYGDATEYPTSENYSPKPLSPYAISKLTSEHYLHYYKHQYGMEFTVLRYSNIYGPRQIPHGEAGVVAIFMENVVNNKVSNLYHFPGEEEGMIRDYCFVGDVAEANLLALQKGNGEAINIGTGKEVRTLRLYLDLIEAYADITGKDCNHVKDPIRAQARPGDIPRSCLRIQKAKEILGWEPRTDLKKGLMTTWEWRLKGVEA